MTFRDPAAIAPPLHPSGSGPDRRRFWAIGLFIVVVVAAAARFYEIGRRSVWFDEGLTLAMVRVTLGEVLSHFWNPTLNNQIFYYLSLRPWHLLGDDIEIVRAFSAAASVGAVWLTCLLGSRLFGPLAGLSAGALLAVHWFAIRYAQEARGYALATLCACAAAFLLMRAVEHGRRRDVAAWVVASALAMYSHSFAMFMIAAQILSLAALGPRTLFRRKDILAGAAAIAGCVLPIVWSLATASAGLISWIPPVSGESLQRSVRALAGGSAWLAYVYAAIFAIVLIRLAIEREPLARWGAALVLLWALAPLAILATISLSRPVLLDRYLVMSVPAWTLAAAAAASTLAARRLLLPGAIALVALPLTFEMQSIGYVYRDAFEDWKTPALVAAREMRPGDSILYESSWSAFAFEYYLERSEAPLPARIQHGELLFSNAFDEAEASAADRVWLILSRENITRGIRLEGLLERSHPKRSSKWAGDLRVMLYER